MDRYNVEWNTILGCGAFAVVVKGWSKAEAKSSAPTPYAVKVVTAEAYSSYYQMINKEVAIMHLLGGHPHLLGLKEVMYGRNRLYMVTGTAAQRCGATCWALLAIRTTTNTV